jgi:hypothetical protein
MHTGRFKAFYFAMMVMAMMGFTNGVLAAEAVSEDAMEQKAGGVKSLEQRVKQLEGAVGRPVEGARWIDRLQISGLIEIEAFHQQIDFKDPAEEAVKENDVDLATVEMVVDVRIVDQVDGHVMFKYEEEDVFVDEGYITLVGTETFPAYLIAGRQYLPFGNFDSHFVTDPNTLILGETNEGAVVAGYRLGGDRVDISVGAFNGQIHKIGDDNAIDSFVAGIAAQPFDFLSVGISYTSNLASADAFFEDALVADELDDLVGGWSAFVTVVFLERFKILGEVVAALDSFSPGEIYDVADTQERQPSAWNVEFGALIVDRLELAIRYGGSGDGAGYLPESQYGAVLNWGFFENTNLALEYLHDEFEDDVQEADTVTAQLAVDF